jgi:2-succinyl-6-hydroxy-2,4-cyclohexadiene-1-carboxylate synthase
MSAMIALHGFTGRADAWTEVAPHATGLALIGHAPDLPVPPAWTFEREVDRIAALLSAPVHLAGYSMGGRVALAVACRWPARVARLTLVAAHPGPGDAAAAAERRDADEKWCALLEAQGIAAFVAAWQEQPMWRTQSALPFAVRERQRLSRLAHAPEQLAAALRALGPGAMPSCWPHLSSLPMPVDWVAGEADDKYAELARRAAALCPRGRAIVIAGAGHNVLLERPDALSRALALEIEA